MPNEMGWTYNSIGPDIAGPIEFTLNVLLSHSLNASWCVTVWDPDCGSGMSIQLHLGALKYKISEMRFIANRSADTQSSFVSGIRAHQHWKSK